MTLQSVIDWWRRVLERWQHAQLEEAQWRLVPRPVWHGAVGLDLRRWAIVRAQARAVAVDMARAESLRAVRGE